MHIHGKEQITRLSHRLEFTENSLQDFSIYDTFEFEEEDFDSLVVMVEQKEEQKIVYFEFTYQDEDEIDDKAAPLGISSDYYECQIHQDNHLTLCMRCKSIKTMKLNLSYFDCQDVKL